MESGQVDLEYSDAWHGGCGRPDHIHTWSVLDVLGADLSHAIAWAFRRHAPVTDPSHLSVSQMARADARVYRRDRRRGRTVENIARSRRARLGPTAAQVS